MTYEPRERPTNPPRQAERTGMGWGIPVAVAALALVAGFFLYNSLSDRTTIAERNSQAPITTNVPTQTPAPIPAPSNAPVKQ